MTSASSGISPQLQAHTAATTALNKGRLSDYEQFGCVEDIIRLEELADLLKDVRLLHINSTRVGGGVAENLVGITRLISDLKIPASWEVLDAPEEFFEVTKSMHNSLRGLPLRFDWKSIETYLRHIQSNRRLLEANPDVVIIHDPQPLPLIDFRREQQK